MSVYLWITRRQQVHPGKRHCCTGKDSANRWLQEIANVCYLARASGLEGDTALAHPHVSSQFAPHQALYHPLRDSESEDKDPASCLGLAWKMLQDTLVGKYLPSDFYVSNLTAGHSSGGQNRSHSSSPAPLTAVVTRRCPGLSSDPEHQLGFWAAKEPAATLVSQAISPSANPPGPRNTRKASGCCLLTDILGSGTAQPR